MNTKNTFRNYSDYSQNWLKENEIKIKQAYVEDGNYNPHFIYITRIGNCGRPKMRMLTRGKDKVKNCILITWNPDRHELEYMRYLVKSKERLFNHFAHGTCHRFLTIDMVAQVLAGCTDERGHFKPWLLTGEKVTA